MLALFSSELNEQELNKYIFEINSWNKFLDVHVGIEITLNPSLKLKDILNPYTKFYYLNLNSFEDFYEEYFIDSLLNLEEFKKPVYVDYSTEIVETIEQLGLSNIKVMKNYKIPPNSVENLDYIDVNIIKEILEFDVKAVSARDFMIKMTVSSDSKAQLESYYLKNLVLPRKKSIISNKNLQYVLNQELKLNLTLLDKYELSTLDFSVYEPIVGNNQDSLTDITEYKWKVFDLIKNLSVKDMTKLPLELLTLFNKNEFIPYNDAREVINGEYRFLKYYTNGGE